MFFSRRVLSAVPLFAMLAGCSIGGGDSRSARNVSDEVRRSGLNSPEVRQCLVDLGQSGVRFQVLDDRSFGSGCSARGAVKLLDIGTPVTNLGAMTCPLASRFAGWVRYGVVPASRQLLGSEVVRVESFGTYSCRGVNGVASNRLSEHASANAVDIAAFVLADGRRISIKADWNSPDPATRRFLRTIHSSACRRFQTVLSPDYNAAHHDHFHMDMGRGPFCR